MTRRNSDRSNAEARRRREAQQRFGDQVRSRSAESALPDSPTEPQADLWAASRSGARAGRGFRYQDLVTALIVLSLWSEGEATALVTPEGYDDISVQSRGGSHFIQVKSRRETAGEFPATELRKHLRSVATAWVKRQDAGLPPATILLLERPVVGIQIPRWDSARRAGSTAGPELSCELDAVFLGDDQARAAFAASISVALCPDPQARAIDIVATARGIPESLAEIIVAAVCTQIGETSNANADRLAANRAVVDIAGIDALVDHVLATVDLELLDEARSLGVCEAIDWGRPGDGSDLRQGAHVGASHVAAGMLVGRPDLIRQVIEVAEARRLVVISGPSGSGKSALAYTAVHETRTLYRWQQIHSLTPSGRTGRDAVALLVARIESLRPSVYAPVGVVIDDAGRHEPNLLDRLLRRLADLPNVVTLVSIREEDRFPVPLLSSIATITPMLDDAFAEELWRDYRAHDLTAWPGWREPAERAGGLLLEYVTLLTEGENLDAVVGAQIRAREADESRYLELEILRLASCANQYGVAVPAYAIQLALDADPGAFTAASRRLIDEHLVIEDSSNLLRPLHEIRSSALARAAHPFGQRESLRRAVALVPTSELARFLRRALESGTDPVVVIQAATERVTRDHELQTLIAVASAFRADGLRRRADDWRRILDECGVDAGDAVTAFRLSRTQPRPDTDQLFKPEIVAAVERLRRVPTDPDVQSLWRTIDAKLVEELVTTAVSDDDTIHLLLQAITVLRGFDPTALEAAADAIGTRLTVWALHDAADITEALRRAAPELAERAVTAAGGEQLLLRRIATETPWLDALDRADDGVAGSWIFIDEELQPDPNESVVKVCRLALALAPTAMIAKVSAVDALGRLVKLGDYPLVDKTIPRENLPHSLEVSENRAQARALARKYGAGTVTSKLAAEATALGDITDLLPEITIAHLGDRAMPQATVRRFQAATALLPEMNAPADEGYTDEVPGTLGDYPVESTAVTVVRSLLQHVIPNLARAVVAERRPILAAGILDDLIRKVGTLIELDRYRYLPDPPDCARLLDSLRGLRMIASASARADTSVRASMRAAAGRHTGSARILAAAAVATERSSVALQKEAARMRIALAGSGYAVAVVPSWSDHTMLSWPPGDLAIVVEGESVLAHLHSVATLADAARNARDQPDRCLWIGLSSPEGFPRASIFQVAHEGVLPLGNREAPSAFASSLGATPISGPYGNYLRLARRLSSIAAIIAIRGSSMIPDDEGRVLEESSEGLVSVKAQLDELTSAHVGTEYASALHEMLTIIGTAVMEDLSTAKDLAEEGRSGWDEIASLQSLLLLDADKAAIAGTDASVVYGTAAVIADIEDDFEGADDRIAHMHEHASNA
ncbi:dsDNA nuclease domain-containing protein [Arthrobacter alkaliphilus]